MPAEELDKNMLRYASSLGVHTLGETLCTWRRVDAWERGTVRTMSEGWQREGANLDEGSKPRRKILHGWSKMDAWRSNSIG